jgi:hypothetical protein
MPTSGLSSIARLVLPVAAAFVCWLIGAPMPAPRGLDAPVTEFSSARADAVLGRLIGPQLPHPLSSPENAAVRDRLLAEFAALGVPASVERARGCRGSTRSNVFSCGTVENIVAKVAPGDGPAVVLLAHYDSVPAGPGAADDLSGVAAILESIRVLQATGMKTKHPVIALITDGEEAGMLGAAAFLSNPAAKASIGAVVNVEGRGNQGVSQLFQTSAGDGPLVSLYAHGAPTPSTSSLSNLIYKQLPNDTDLTLFIDAQITSFNFGFIKNLAQYHTPLDRRENLSSATLQQHGDNLVGVAQGLMDADFADLAGDDAMYLSVAGLFVPRIPKAWGPPLAAVALMLVLAAAFGSRSEPVAVWRRALAAVVPLLVIVGSVGGGWLLHLIAAKISGHADPSYATPAPFRAALSLGVGGVAVLCSRLSGPRLMALSVWGFLSAIAAITAVLAPGLSPLFLFPVLVSTPMVFAQSRRVDAWSGPFGTIALAVAALPTLVIWMSFARLVEPVQGLMLHPGFTAPVAIAALSVLPMVAGASWSRRAWLVVASGSMIGAVGLAGLAGLQPAYTPESPQRLNITAIDDHVAGRQRWALDTTGTVPASLREVSSFSESPERVWPVSVSPSYVAEAGPTRFPAPTAAVSVEPVGVGRIVTVELDASTPAHRRFIVVPSGSGLTRLEVDGQAYTPKPGSEATTFICWTRDCGGTKVQLHFDSMRVVDAFVATQRYGLPAEAAPLVAARPSSATPSQSGDSTIVFGRISLP